MHASREDMPVAYWIGEAESRLIDWGDMTVAFQRFPAGLDSASLFEELPDGHCPCHHWGYVFKGRMRFRTKDGEEIVEAGDAYYIPPGHTGEFLEDTEVIEFSRPKAEFRMTEEVSLRKMQARQK